MSRASTAPDTEESALIQAINAYRLQNSLTPLATSPTLTASAQWKSADMVANGYFAHDDLSRSWSQRIHDCGYNASPSVAENLAEGTSDAASTLAMWQNSAPHNANLLDPSMRALGVARATDGTTYGWYWTADFGAVADVAPAAAPASSASSAGATPTSSAPTSYATPAPTPVATAAPGAGVGLTVGGSATVTGTGDCLHVHSMPAVSAPIAACLADGAAAEISDGPRSNDGYTWWKISGVGWAVSAYLAPVTLPLNAARAVDTVSTASSATTDGTATSAPSPTPAATPASTPAADTGLALGSSATVVGTGRCLHIHSQPSINAPRTACLGDGTQITLTDGPLDADGFTWWKLGSVGWAVSVYLTPTVN